jgi:hypothetical protein
MGCSGALGILKSPSKFVTNLPFEGKKDHV